MLHLKNRYLRYSLCALLLIALLAGCGAEPEENRVDLVDAIGGSSIVTASDLLAFLERGESDTAQLSADINLGEEMLRITKSRGRLIIDGKGFTLSGAGDCVIRLEDGASITLNNITLHSGADAIGCLGNAAIGGSSATLIGVSNGIRAVGELSILPGSNIISEAKNGTGVIADTLMLQMGARLSGSGPMGGANVRGDIQLLTKGHLAAYTEENYNALKCGGTLTMEDGAKLTAENRGAYLGAELTSLAVRGAATIEVKGGKNSSGLFLFEQLEDIIVIGSCEPKARFESGKGSITFVDKLEDIPARTPEPTPDGATQ